MTTSAVFPPCPAPFNLARHVLRAGAATPDKLALSVLGSRTREDWRYGDLIAAVRGTAAGLLQSGLRPGDMVLMRLGNTPDFPQAYLGALAAGLVPVPTATSLTTPEIGNIIAKLAPAAILRDPDVACPDAGNIIGLPELRRMRDLPAADWHMGDPERLGYIIYTSGTSGIPAAVMHAHRAIWARQMMFDGWYGLSIADRMLHAGAFNWTYTLGTGLTDPWTVGATALIPAPGTAPTELPSLIARHDVTIFAAAPGVYRQMLKTPFSAKTPALRHGLSAGEKLPLPVRAAWEAATGIQVYEAFGMSECSTFISASPSTPAKDGALGCAQPGRQVCILSDTRPAPAGTPGTIAIHKTDPGLMLGYYNAPDQTARRYSGDWFLTGDQGVLDADNQITYLGRADDMMNAGGFRVSPLEVEAVLLHAPGITGVGVTEVVVRDGVSIIAAFCTTNAPLDEAAVDAYAKAHLARYKQPRIILQVDSLPTGANGKLLRRKLRSDYEANN